MTLLGFKERFVPNVEAGYAEQMGKPYTGHPKRHSIRAGKLRHTVGRPIQLYRRVRQKDMRKIIDADPVCVRTEEISILPSTVIIDHRELTYAEINRLARADGFLTAHDFFAFFLEGKRSVFEGHIIHWDWLS